MTPSLQNVVGLPNGPFRCIVADPPWPYGTRDAITRCIKQAQIQRHMLAVIGCQALTEGWFIQKLRC